MLISRIVDSVRQFFLSAPPPPPPPTRVTSTRTVAAPPTAPAAAVPAPSRQPELSPPAPTRMTAVEILRNEPNLSAGQLADRAGVTLSYANSLVRRQRSRPVAVPAATVRPIAVPVASVSEDRAKTQILASAAAGSNTIEIAEQLCLAPGEVEFVLKLARLAKKS